jgi:3-keto-5-aminohexanoate cleavage enzyme
VRIDRNTLASSNAALVKRAVAICEKHGRPVATWAQAREILKLEQR